ncbi:MAG: T9SS type A sorting domain-containing protein [Flavobacteriales bacterium]|nr:T9SS type A sorting domain-containing protein [Flavobacteriales bacterium]
MPGLIVGPLRHIYANPARDTIYFAGIISLTGSSNGWQQTNSIMRYTSGDWDTLGVINGQVQTVVQYRDTLIAGGLTFLTCSGTPCSGATYWDGNAWQPYGDFGAYGVRMLRVLDGDLYAVGGFTEVDGQPATGVAKRVGNSWQPVGALDLQGSIIDIAAYDGKLVVIGNVDFPNGRNIAEWDGNEWSLLGPGIIDLMSGGQCLAVYQGDLYVGGQIRMVPPGNPGQNIMRWDGTQFRALGQGIQAQLGNTSMIATVFEMVEHEGKLFVGGGFRAAGGILADGLATWDGVEWCAVLGDFTTTAGIKAMDFYQDTLFVACGTTLDGDTVNGTAKFIGEEYTTVCSGPVGLSVSPRNSQLGIHPNPGTDQVWITGLSPGTNLIEVRDPLGRTVHMQRMTEAAGNIETSSWAIGIYFIRVTGTEGTYQVLQWVKE